MKRSTALILSFAGAGIASAFLLADPVAGATSGAPLLAAGAEGLVALGGAYYAWKKNSKAGAIVGGVAAGLLATTIKANLLQPPAATPTALAAPPNGPSKRFLPRHPAPQIDTSAFTLTPEPDYSGFTLASTPELIR